MRRDSADHANSVATVRRAFWIMKIRAATAGKPAATCCRC
jgi:uncharacterized membrane-anchored protein